MAIHPSQFLKCADGTRFVVLEVSGGFAVIGHGVELIATCDRRAMAEMVAAALERWARDGETFDAEEKPCK